MNFPGINMATGHSQDAEDKYAVNYIDNIMAMVGVFFEDAIKLGAVYSLHSGRKVVCKNDVSMGMKTRAFHGDHFWNQPGIQQRIADMKEMMCDSDDDMEEEYEEEEEECEDTEDTEEIDQEAIDLDQELGQYQWTPSNCMCEICTALNQIDTKWDNWHPINPTEISIKNSVIKALN